MKLVSACLIGLPCAYHGGSNISTKVVESLKKESFTPVCPEMMGGLTTPRSRARIVGGDGTAVLAGKARVVTMKGVDVTDAYIKGAKEVLRIAKKYMVKEAIMKSLSPSCGCGHIYSDDFSKEVTGDGITVALLKKNNVKIMTELDIK